MVMDMAMAMGTVIQKMDIIIKNGGGIYLKDNKLNILL